MDDDLRGYDPGAWGHSLANVREILVAVLDTAKARTVTEVGAFAGDLTRELADWAEQRGGEVIAVDPFPEASLSELEQERASVRLVREPSFEALRHIPRTDAIVIDGDHNYYTVSQELQTIGERFAGEPIPLLILHDVRWPHARRDAYYAPDAIPEDERHQLQSGPIFPGVSEFAPGLPYRNVATHEGGPRNGVLTALEDFLQEQEDLRFAIVSAFYGVAIVWPATAEWAGQLERLLSPLDRAPWLERLERNRVYNLARFYQQSQVLEAEIQRLRELNQSKADMLERLDKSRAFRLGDRLSHFRRRNGASWREQVKQLIRER